MVTRSPLGKFVPTSGSSSGKSEAPDVVTMIARRLIAGELRQRDSSDSLGPAAFRVCEKLRQPLSKLIGMDGFRSLLTRALTLAQGEVPWLDGAEVGADGAIKLSGEMQAQLDADDAASGGTALLAQLHGLLITFIGAALTLRLVHNVQEAAIIN